MPVILALFSAGCVVTFGGFYALRVHFAMKKFGVGKTTLFWTLATLGVVLAISGISFGVLAALDINLIDESLFPDEHRNDTMIDVNDLVEVIHNYLSYSRVLNLV